MLVKGVWETVAHREVSKPEWGKERGTAYYGVLEPKPDEESIHESHN